VGIEIFRDWVISIGAIVALLSLTMVAILALMLYRKACRILASLEAVAGKLRSASAAVNEDTMRPIMQLIAVFQGVNQIRNMFQKKKEANDGRATG
jgi:hypothetical protein